jgi:ubiquinone/menaquinone biosynthesis C-methylase UbiE
MKIFYDLYMAGKHQLQIAKRSVNKTDWSSKKVLDIGCSNGSLTYEILKLTKAREIVGIDLDKERIAKAKKLKNKKLQFLLSDASNMRVFPNDSFDVVFSNMAFQQFDDFRIVLKEVYRILRPKGQAVINFNQEKREVWFEMYKLKAKYFGLSKKISKEKKLSAMKFKKEAKKIGFSKINVVSRHDTYYFKNIDDLLGKPKDFGFDHQKYEKIWEELRRIFEKRKTNKGYKESWDMVYCRLVK